MSERDIMMQHLIDYIADFTEEMLSEVIREAYNQEELREDNR